MNFPTDKYRVIYADPPWRFKYQSETNRTARYKRTTRHYPTMSLQDICALPVPDIADKDCALFMWAIYPMLPQALEVIEAWGFTYKTVAFTWLKTNQDASLFRGMGYWTMANAEICLLATKGHPKRARCDVPQALLASRDKHSRKPPEVRSRIEALMGDVPRTELFARERAPGWDAWGNQVPDEMQPTLLAA